ncbi:MULTISPECIES: baseplate J/gp47 family protein [Brucella]|uniref:Baseplate J-like family protein n=1 Tax=Brucella pseudogrignonensis TaxID=419475 RepID=A0A256GCX5_9HYPH|nr:MULTISPECIES: baseplate J/gp47 family protein [Brucella]MDG9793725.1 baseplate J/gp47 family protein [Brucella anthropi]MDH0583620.1 baseplate J/gp47 family protein [Brucella anthropi]MDH0820128.1 baseplate J/gp47 family protein [Brucella anthropi]MDH2086977.1 baseplate J/gp47 family protein [Brucella anthropi]NVM42060.1 baseplate J/gp47 family protein [Brucella intermedia]
MPWPVPSAKTIAERIASAMEFSISVVRPLVDPLAISRAVRSARGMLAMISRAVALEAREIHDHVAWWGRQYFVDTAEDEFVQRHADIWGIVARPATFAVGKVDIEGAAGTPIPADLEIAGSDGTIFKTTETAIIGPNGGAAISVIASVAGPAGNLEAGIRLRTVTAFPEINRIAVAAEGIAGGAEAETPAELADATMAYIRQRPHGGAGFDYPTWLREKFAVRAVKPETDWIGRGSVGVIVAMKDGTSARTPTESEMTEMLSYLGAPGSSSGVRPVTAHVVIVPAEMRAIPITVRVRPDKVATRAAVQEAYAAFIATIGDANDDQNESPIGARIEPSRISEAISAASGEYAHDLISPSAPFTLDRDQYPLPGEITFEEPL